MTDEELMKIESSVEWATKRLGYIPRSSFDALVAEVRRARSLLVAIQWRASEGRDGDPACPACGAREGVEPHEAACELALLAELPRKDAKP